MTENIKTIVVNELSKSFGETLALDKCNFSAFSGSVNAVVGENGSGKSTLVKILSGVLNPDHGQISILGKTPKNPLEAKKIGLSTIFQEILIANELSITENIFMGHEDIFGKKISKNFKINKSYEVLKRLSDIDFDVEADAGSLPLNEKQWVVIARAVVSDPKILIFDESSAALDLEATKKLHSEMRRLCKLGTTIIIISHRIKELVNIADHVTILRDGKTVSNLNGKEITEENLIHHLTRGKIKASINNTDFQKNNMPINDKVSIECNNLTLKNNSKGFDTRINQGQILGVTGLDGQGQANFIKILSGINQAFTGDVITFDEEGEKKNINNLNDSYINKVVYISGDRSKEGIFPNLSILENFGFSMYRNNLILKNIINFRSVSKNFDEYATKLSLKFGKNKDLITSLSGGNQQKVLIARALSNNPKILILNDPARGVDISTKNEIHNQLKIFAKNGGTVIYLSTEIEEFFDFVDEVYVFYSFNLHTKLTGSDINEDKIMSSIFGQ